ncbi:MAG: cupin domain-containing protein [Acidobacteria bacterium]|nr:cupin domain-containing protein [Acidobacteriota bacterium]
MTKINIAEKLSQFSEHWSPKIVAELNGQHLKLVKFQGEFVWHHHTNEDELFLVVEGEFTMEYKDAQGEIQSILLRKNEFLNVPKGTEHIPVAAREVSVLLFEPAGTLNTGTATDSTYTVADPVRL